ncbi:unnamed protein product, partial [marine sediment metagenome]
EEESPSIVRVLKQGSGMAALRTQLSSSESESDLTCICAVALGTNDWAFYGKGGATSSGSASTVLGAEYEESCYVPGEVAFPPATSASAHPLLYDPVTGQIGYQP